MQTIAEALSQLQQNTQATNGKKLYIPEWKKEIPPWSLWEPGFTGRPDCRGCLGLGVVRVEVSIGHPFFGKLFSCECVGRGVLIPAPVEDKEEQRARSMRRARKDIDGD